MLKLADSRGGASPKRAPSPKLDMSKSNQGGRVSCDAKSPVLPGSTQSKARLGKNEKRAAKGFADWKKHFQLHVIFPSIKSGTRRVTQTHRAPFVW